MPARSWSSSRGRLSLRYYFISDNDLDGWVDALDPDCMSGSTEQGVYSATACNNNIDDDIDGAIDAADTGCVHGSDNGEL